ncbi:MAG TPA: RNA methyltransferase [Bacillota bacterium]|jgi:TrmH family RNA methyltransferase
MTTVISSRANPLIREITKLKSRHGRGKDERFLVEGVRLVEEALRAGLTVETAVVSADVGPKGRLADLLNGLERAGARLITVSASILGELAETDSPQGLVVVVRRPAGAQADDIARLARRPGPGGPPLVLVLDGLQDPGNLGTILRTAEACAVSGVVAGKGTADPYQPKALRASMGAAFRAGPAIGADPQAIAEVLRREGLTIVATVADDGEPLTRLNFSVPAAIVIGGEGAGVSGEWLDLVDRKGTISTPGPTESLNAAVAAAIFLYEALRQRRLT